MTDQISKITWTHTDEAPALASYSLLPIVNAFTKAAGVIVETKDISLAARIISAFPEKLSEEQKITDDLAELGEMTQKPETNIIKLPNISASIPQLKDAIKELQSKGYDIPNYPEEVETEAEKQLVQRFAKLLGSAVNPVLRQGNSDRRAAASVKKFAMKNPHKMMKPWGENSKTHVAYMKEGDFYGNEKSIVTEKGIDFKIILEDISGNTQILKDNLKSLDGEILDGTFMSKNALRQFYTEQIEDAKDKDILLSLHLKATMMKVSDPIMFGHAVSIYYKDVLEKYEDIIEELGVNLNNGIGELYDKIKTLPEAKQNEIKAEIKAVYNVRPELAMVDSDNGITNLHAPNKVIVDASMPVVIRDGGKMWGTDGKLHDTKAMIPDRCYATMYQAVVDDCNVNGAFNPAKMGNVSNVGLMAQKAEEYGSHPTTFEIPENGTVKVIDASGAVLMESNVEKGDIWRMSRAKDIPVEDWVKLAVSRTKSIGVPAVFWLDKNRAHDRKVIIKVEKYLKNYDLKGLDIRIMSPDDAMKYTLKRVREGKDTISVSGNVIRDYLTDLFPILELGTSAKMLSIVPLIAGGGLFETGAGGSAPKHVQQFNEEGHLRWDSLGEFLALMVSMEFLADKFNNSKAKVLSETLDKAISKYLENKKSPSRKAGELDNRGTHFYLAQYWAKELNNQNEDLNLKKKFSEIASQLVEKENDILKEIASAEGHSTDIGGYFLPNFEKAEKAMRPSKILNNIINNLS
ncbi:MAG: NADP-dependent isocitrate dehydrogenase [Bacteroidales bacterium]|nr:NADP-dependent isocitrate dehydrogenase [Bacteroidales bacterium]